MAILFSAVTETADDEQVEFFCAGIPREFDDLEGWTAFEDFLGEIDHYYRPYYVYRCISFYFYQCNQKSQRGCGFVS